LYKADAVYTALKKNHVTLKAPVIIHIFTFNLSW